MRCIMRMLIHGGGVTGACAWRSLTIWCVGKNILENIALILSVSPPQGANTPQAGKNILENGLKVLRAEKV